jgi:hypothetical protein
VNVSRALELLKTTHQPHVSVPVPRRALKPPSRQKRSPTDDLPHTAGLFEVVTVAGDFSTDKGASHGQHTSPRQDRHE